MKKKEVNEEVLYGESWFSDGAGCQGDSWGHHAETNGDKAGAAAVDLREA